MPSARGYSAGRVFLQVVPSYDKFMTSLRRDTPALAKAFAASLKKDMDKEGAHVGESFGEKINRGVKKSIDDGAFAQSIEKQIAGVEKALGRPQAELRRLQKQFNEGKLSSNQLSRALHDQSQEYERLARATDGAELSMRQNLNTAAKSIQTHNEHSRALERARVEQEKSARANKETSKTIKDLDHDSNAVERGLFRLSSMFRKNGSDSQAGANAFRFFNFALLAVAAVGVGLIPILAAVGGGVALLGSLAMAGAAGVGVFALALSGISGAVKAIHAQQDATAGSSRAMDKAVRSASKGIRDALDSQRQAEKNLASAQRDAKKAQEDLTAARKAAKLELQDLNDQVAQNALDERQAVIDLFNANNTYGATMSDGGSTNLEKEQSSIGLSQAQLNLKRIRQEQQRLAAEKAHADKTGINGTKTVMDAQDNLQSALQREVDARQQVKKAIEGVKDAQENYNDALAGGVAVADKLSQALSQLSPEGRRFAYFIAGLRDGLMRLRRVAEAGMLPGLQESMERIIRVYGPGMTRFVDKMSRALGDLFVQAGITFTNPVWRDFFTAMANFATTFITDFGQAMLNFMTGLAAIFTEILPTSEAFSKSILGISENFKGWATSEEGREKVRKFFAYVKEVGPKVREFFGALVDAVVKLGIAFAPLGESVLSFLTDFLRWIAGMDPDKLRAFGVGLLALVVALQSASGIMAVISVSMAIINAPLILIVAAVMGLVAAFFFLSRSGKDNQKTFDNLKKTFGPLGKSLKDLWSAFQPVARVLRKVADLVAKRLIKTFREDLLPAVKDIVDVLRKNLFPAFVRFQPILIPVAKVLLWVFGTILGGIIRAAKDLIVGFVKVLSGLMDFITGVFTGNWSLAWDGIKQIFFGLVQGIWGLVNLYFFGKILGGIKAVGKGIWTLLKKLFTKDVPGMLKGAFSKIWQIITYPLKVINSAFTLFKNGFINGIKDLVKKVPELLKKVGGFFGEHLGRPISKVVDLVLNKGVIGFVNKIAGWLHLPGSKNGLIKELPVHKFATGGIAGVVPGYAPGVDRHHIMVGGGEAIMRPEVTRVMGKGMIDGLNNAAIQGGVGGVQRVLGDVRKFATGGIVWPTTTRALSPDYPGHTGVDIRAAMGSRVFSAHAGRVSATPHWNYSYGNHVRVKGSDGFETIYGHLSKILTRVGALVQAGTIIGKSGSSGNSTGPHLHFEVRPGGSRAAALAYLYGSRIPKGIKGEGDLEGSLGGAAKKMLRNPLKYLKSAVSGGFDKISGIGGGAMDMMKSIPKEFFGGIVKWVGSKGKDLLGKAFFKGTPLGMALNLFGVGGSGGKAGHNLYDDGGYLPPGLSMVMNKTGRPEPVLTSDQWDKIAHGGGGFSQTNNFLTKPLSAEELAQELAFQGRRARRSGKITRKAD